MSHQKIKDGEGTALFSIGGDSTRSNIPSLTGLLQIDRENQRVKNITHESAAQPEPMHQPESMNQTDTMHPKNFGVLTLHLFTTDGAAIKHQVTENYEKTAENWQNTVLHDLQISPQQFKSNESFIEFSVTDLAMNEVFACDPHGFIQVFNINAQKIIVTTTAESIKAKASGLATCLQSYKIAESKDSDSISIELDLAA